MCIALDRDCVEICIPIASEELIADDGAICMFMNGDEPCKWVCNGTCTEESKAGVTEVGAVYISTEERDEDTISEYVHCVSKNDTKKMTLMLHTIDSIHINRFR